MPTSTLNNWLLEVLGEEDGSEVIASSNNSLQRVSQTFETLRRHGRLDETFFNALAEHFEGREAEINTAKTATLNETRGWRSQLTTLLLNLFVDPLFGDNQDLDDFFAAQFDWFKQVLHSISAASSIPVKQYTFKVAGALQRRGWLNSADFYRNAQDNVREDLKPVLLHVWWMQQEQVRKRGI